MDYVIVLSVVLSITGAFVVCAWIHARRTRSAARDDLVRVGDEADVTPTAAARRAEGEAAWTRLGGGV